MHDGVDASKQTGGQLARVPIVLLVEQRLRERPDASEWAKKPAVKPTSVAEGIVCLRCRTSIQPT
jgi:hypothetical protein